jgi:hypothetical protein
VLAEAGSLQGPNHSPGIPKATCHDRPPSTLTFQAGSIQTIQGSLTLKGSAMKLLQLRSSQQGTAWDIDPLGTALLSFVDVKDCLNLSSTTISATSSHNSGNNTRVNFPVA